MDLIAGVRLFLLDQAEIAALVVARVYTPILPQKVTMPAVQLQLIDDLDELHLRGPIETPIARVQVDAWAGTRDAAKALGRLCRQRLHGFKGVWTGTESPPGTLTVSVIRYVDGSEHFEEDIQGGSCRHMADYRIRYKDSEDRVLI